MSQGLALSDRRGITTTAAAVAIAVIVVVAAGSAYYALDVRGASTSTKEIVFGATLSMTGDLQAFGQEQNWTLSLAVQMINSYGG
ncbi:MAG: hypothetical protein JRN54_06340, partial [Nitrososphaerota archaeon]|nr:hypothetical protein [Nitrososphaerota archaeon]